jgi:hypothetical protein
MADRLWRWADVAWCIFPPVGIVLDLCSIICGAIEFWCTPPEEMRRG